MRRLRAIGAKRSSNPSEAPSSLLLLRSLVHGEQVRLLVSSSGVESEGDGGEEAQGKDR